MSSSSSSSRKLTSKEKEILLRQRALSLQRQGVPPPPPPPPTVVASARSATQQEAQETRRRTSNRPLLLPPSSHRRPPPPPGAAPPSCHSNKTMTSALASSSLSSRNGSHGSQNRKSNSSSVSGQAFLSQLLGMKDSTSSQSSQKSHSQNTKNPLKITKNHKATNNTGTADSSSSSSCTAAAVQTKNSKLASMKMKRPNLKSSIAQQASQEKKKTYKRPRPKEMEEYYEHDNIPNDNNHGDDDDDDDEVKILNSSRGVQSKTRRGQGGILAPIPPRNKTKTSHGTHVSTATRISGGDGGRNGTIGGAGGGGGGRLSSLLHRAAGIAESDMSSSDILFSKMAENADTIESILDMDDYYHSLRSWDFLREWDEMQRRNGKEGYKEDPSPRERGMEECPMVVPDVFRSCRQYQKIWAPLCLQETKAQYLADVTGKKRGRGSGIGNGDFDSWRVMVKPLEKDVGSANIDGMMVIVSLSKEVGMARSVSRMRESGVGEEGVFMSGDLVCLTRKQEAFVMASEGKLRRWEQEEKGIKRRGRERFVETDEEGEEKEEYDEEKVLHGITGHVEYSRKNVDGLKVRISRRQWIKFCKGVKLGDMYLWNIGGNVTSAREFAALCRVNMFSMLPYILCRKMTKAKDNLDLLTESIVGDPDSSTDVKVTSEKDNHLMKLGGNAALGEGFVNHVRNKFNVSQLGAIASAACEYGHGGFTLIKGPPGTGKSTTLVAILNALHIRQFNRYYQTVHDIVDVEKHQSSEAAKLALADAGKKKPRILVCAPSNNAIDNVIQKIMESGFVDGAGRRYNPSIVRVGVGQGDAVKDVSLEATVNRLMTELEDPGKVQDAVARYKSELQRIQSSIHQLRRRIMAVLRACDYPLAKEWEIRCDENCRIHFVNHMEKRTTFERPPPPAPGETFRPAKSQPEYKLFSAQLVKLVDRFASISSKLERYNLMKKPGDSPRLQLETHVLDNTHIVFTTLGTAGCLALESSAKFEVVVVDEAAQSVEPSTLVALQLGSSHAVLVGDPQQLPATIFNVSGRTTKYDRSLFQRLEEAGHEVHLLDTQYRMHPQISKFPRHIFYGGYLKDGPNVSDESYGNPLSQRLRRNFPCFHPLTVFNLDSSEQRGGSSLSNMLEAKFALQLYQQLSKDLSIFFTTAKVSIITPYAQQASLIRKIFSQSLGTLNDKSVEINTVDSFQGREADVVILSCVRAAGSKGIGFLSDVRRMNVALTRSKHFLFVIARCQSICVNPYWDQLVTDARNDGAIVFVPRRFVNAENGGDLSQLKTEVVDDVNCKLKK